MLGNLQIGSINGVGFMPVNLVINPEFTVNQRGAASRTAATGYNYDRWYYDGSSLLQGIENLNLRATTYVVSWSGSATCSYSLNTAASSSQGGQTYTSITNGGTLTISSLGSNNLWIKFSGTLTDLTNVMVAPSAAQTPFISRQYPQELALCQRYCINYTSTNNTNNYCRFGVGTNSSTTQTAFVIYPYVPMRTYPSLTTTGTASNYLTQYGGGGSTSANTDVPVLNDASENHITIVATCSAVLTTGYGAQIMANNNKTAYLLLTAEL